MKTPSHPKGLHGLNINTGVIFSEERGCCMCMSLKKAQENGIRGQYFNSNERKYRG